MWWNGGGVGWAGWLVMTLTMIAFWGLLLVAAVAIWRAGDRGAGRGGADRDRAGPGGDTPAPGRAPGQLLDERFARGEIDEEEYLRRRDVLGSAR